MTTAMSLAEVKAHLSELVNRVASQHERVTVTVHGRSRAVLVAAEDLDSLEETLAILSDSETVQRLSVAELEIAAGEGESEAELAVAMRQHGRLSGA